MALTRSLLATIARKGGSRLLDMAIARTFPAVGKAMGPAAGKAMGPAAGEAKVQAGTDAAPEAKPEPKPKPSLTRGLAGAAVTRIATRSVPGAILIGGGIIAKKLYDRRRAKGRNGRA